MSGDVSDARLAVSGDGSKGRPAVSGDTSRASPAVSGDVSDARPAVAFDRTLYGGGATFAGLLSPLFDGETVHVYHPERGLDRLTDAEKASADVLWGLSLRDKLTAWPRPLDFITVLRHPVLRFVSLALSIKAYRQWNSFWELELFQGEPGLDGLAAYVDRYRARRETFSRPQSVELTGAVDYSGLEWYRSPKVYPDGPDPLSGPDGVERAIEFLENNFSDVYILELQEESLFHLALTRGLDPDRLELKPIKRHQFYSAWDVADIDPETLLKIRLLTAGEMRVYNHFREKFERGFASLAEGRARDCYLTYKSASIAAHPKFLRHYLMGSGLYLPAGMAHDRELTARMDGRLREFDAQNAGRVST